MKVVAVQGSPHTGNTYARVEQFAEALRSLGDVTFEHIRLKDAKLEPCRGCFACFSHGEDACPLKDDREAIEHKMFHADAVVFASPVYAMHISSLLKRFVDRLAYTFHRPRYFGRYALGLCVTGGIGLKPALQYIRMFSGAWGFEHIGSLRYIDPPRHSAMPRLMKTKDRTRDMAGKLHELMRTKPARRLTSGDYLMFHMMRAVYKRMKPFAPVDHAYWQEQGWLASGARYFTEHARTGVLKSLYPRLAAWCMGRVIDKELAKSENTRKGGDTGQ